MSERLTLNAQQIQFLRSRYTRMLTQLLPIAYKHYQHVTGVQVKAAIEAVMPYSDAILNLFSVYLDEGRYQPDEEECYGLVKLLLMMSQYLSQRGLWTEALRWGLMLLEISENHGWSYDPALIAHLIRAHIEAADPATNRRFLERSLGSHIAQTDPVIAALLRIGMSGALFQLGQYEAALQFGLQAVETPLESPEPALQADAWLNIFAALTALNRNEDALEAAVNAVQNALETDPRDEMRLAAAVSVLALAHTAVGKVELGQELHEQGITLYERIGDEPNAARGWFMFAVNAFKQGDYARSAELARACLLVFERYRLHDDAQRARQLLAMVEHKL